MRLDTLTNFTFKTNYTKYNARQKIQFKMIEERIETRAYSMNVSCRVSSRDPFEVASLKVKDQIFGFILKFKMLGDGIVET